MSTGAYHLFGPWVSSAVLIFSLTLYSSLNHEVLHGHPFKNDRLNTALIFPALGLFIPYMRFRDTHLAHHHDPSLTDPYDDPESNFIDPAVWSHWSFARRLTYQFNNTLLGRILIGPVITLWSFYRQDWSDIWRQNSQVRDAYLFHFLGLIPVCMWWAMVSEMSVWVYLICAYGSLSILKIRTFLEHRAHEKARCRSVIIEDRGILSFLFLRNNLHAVHHAHPGMPWYRLQQFYAENRAGFLARNGGYSYRSYLQIMRLYLVAAKDPVPHNLWNSTALKVPEHPVSEPHT
ncbi:MAG: fatty acid desaturase [Paracoccaceae bacterium]|nr:fatty acid desaturase [Paracoccaceae bacterium]